MEPAPTWFEILADLGRHMALGVALGYLIAPVFARILPKIKAGSWGAEISLQEKSWRHFRRLYGCFPDLDKTIFKKKCLLTAQVWLAAIWMLVEIILINPRYPVSMQLWGVPLLSTIGALLIVPAIWKSTKESWYLFLVYACAAEKEHEEELRQAISEDQAEDLHRSTLAASRQEKSARRL